MSGSVKEVQGPTWQSFNIELERSLLGCLIVHGQTALEPVQGLLEPEHFYEGVNRAAYECILKASADGRVITPQTLGSYFSEDGFDLGPEQTFAKYLLELIKSATVLMNCRPYAVQIVDHARRRRLSALTEQFTKRLSDPFDRESGADLARQMQTEIDAATTDRPNDVGLRRVSLGKSSESVVREVEAVMAGDRKERGMSLGVERLNHMLGGGLHRQKLVIVAGRPGMGKTSAGLSFAMSMAKQGHGIYFVSLEMAADELTRRALSCMAYDRRQRPLTYSRITSADDMTPEELWRLDEARRAVAGYPLLIEQEPGLAMAQIATRAQIARQQFEMSGVRLGAIVVDHLGLIRVDDRYRGNRVQEVAELTGALKNMSRTMDCAVVALCQLNRESEKRDNKRPQLSDLRDSGSIEQDADIIMGLFREAYYLRRAAEAGDGEAMARLPDVENILEIEILKQRNGETGRVTAFCDIGSNVITGLEA